MSFGTEPEKAEMQLFISHSSKDREWVEPVCKRIEASGFRAHLAEYDLAGLGHELSSKIQEPSRPVWPWWSY